MRILPAYAIIVATTFPGAALANDSVAEIGAGGLILVNADAISMAKEDLYVSPSEVRVNYVFRNNSEDDQTHIVAFPMPDIDPIDYTESDNGIANRDSDNFMDFKVKVAGEEVRPQLEMRALSAGIDITERLKALGIPLNPLSEAAREKLKSIPDADKRTELELLGAIRVSEEYVEPTWSLRSTYYWQQTFPGGGTLEVSHTYKPAAGGTFFGEESLTDPSFKDTYCIDESTAAALRKKLAGLPKDGSMLLTTQIEYILTTGNNWQGSIGDFRLVVDKEKPEAIVSFCMDGVTKIAPTEFEVRRQEFYPDKELKVLIVNAPEPPE